MTETAFCTSFRGVTQVYNYQNDLVHSSRLQGLVVCHNMGHSYCMLSDAEFIDSSQNSCTYRTWCCTQKAFGNYLCFRFFYIWHHCLHIRQARSKPPTTTTVSAAQLQCWLPHSKPHLLQESNLVLNMGSKFWHFGVWILHQYYHETQL